MLNFAKDLAAALDALRRHAILFLLAVAIVALALLGRSWLDARDATARLAATLAAQQKTITDADQRQSTRDAQLTQTLAQIAATKKKVQTPAQAAAALSQAIPQFVADDGLKLPSPITIEIPSATGADSVARILEPGAVPRTVPGSDSKSEFDGTDSTATSTQNKSSAPLNPASHSPWSSLKSRLAKIGIGRASKSATIRSGKNSEIREGSAASQQGSGAAGSSANTAPANSPPASPANSHGEATSTQPNSAPARPAISQAGITPAPLSSSQATTPNSQRGVTGAQANSAPASTANSQSGPPPAIIRVPREDLKPLYDAVEDCQACHATLAAAQGDLADERAKFAAATAQRDAAISAARGTFWKRTRTAAKWIVIGAAAGALLAKYH